MTAGIRPAAVAGLFYPAAPAALRQQIDACLQGAGPVGEGPPPLAIITPHAGYSYSGPTAAIAWKAAASRAPDIERVLLLGPSHRVALCGIASSPASQWQTPLGPIALDQQGATALQTLPFVDASALAHQQEHSLEVQVPFIQTLLPNATLLPLVVGDASPEEVAAILRPYWRDPRTLIAISSDLSHFHDYQQARAIDQTTSRAIERLDYTAIGPQQACGCRALNGLLKLAAEDGGAARTLSLCNSGDTAGDRQRVVGYGAYVIQ